MENRLIRIENKLDRIELKIDTAHTSAVEARAAVAWMKYIVGGAWLAIAGLFLGHK